MPERIGTSAGAITGAMRKLANSSGRAVPQVLFDKAVNVSAACAPFYLFVKKLGKKKTVRQDSYKHLETDWLPQAVYTAAGLADGTGTATLTVTAGHEQRCQKGTILKVLSTGEELLVTVAPVANSGNLIVTRGSAHAVIPSTSEIEILSMSAYEGSISGDGYSSEPQFTTNYVQTFRAPIEISGRDLAGEFYGGDDWERIKKDCTEMVLQQIEKAFLFQETSSASDPTRTKGALGSITTNVTNTSGVLTESVLRTEMVKWFRRNHGAKNLIFFAGERVIQALDGYGRDLLRYKSDDNVIGLQTQGYRSAFGEITIVPHGMMSPVGSDVTAANLGWQGYAMFLNMENLGRAVFANREWIPSDEIQVPGQDSRKWELLTDEGFICTNEKSHGIIRGVTG